MGLLKRLMADEAFGIFNLVGGTALALQIGHRKSIDLDMFTHADFSASEVLELLIEKSFYPQVKYSHKQTLIVEIEGIKVDFIRFRYPYSHNIQNVEGIRLVNMKDIACMKVDAIMGRGRKKDFYDLYFLLKHFSLMEIMKWYSEMFQHTTLFHVYKRV